MSAPPFRPDTEDAWRERVVVPLRITVGDPVGGIERRQRGFDCQQEEVQAEISRLLQTDGFGAVEQSQSLLDRSTDTLRALNEVLLRDTHHFVALLQEIQALARCGLCSALSCSCCLCGIASVGNRRRPSRARRSPPPADPGSALRERSGPGRRTGLTARRRVPRAGAVRAQRP